MTDMRVPILVATLLDNPQYRRATYYAAVDTVVRLTCRHRFTKRARRHEFVLTVGEPNYTERKFITACKKAKEPFPVKKVQCQLWPVKRPKTKGKKK